MKQKKLIIPDDLNIHLNEMRGDKAVWYILRQVFFLAFLIIAFIAIFYCGRNTGASGGYTEGDK